MFIRTELGLSYGSYMGLHKGHMVPEDTQSK